MTKSALVSSLLIAGLLLAGCSAQSTSETSAQPTSASSDDQSATASASSTPEPSETKPSQSDASEGKPKNAKADKDTAKGSPSKKDLPTLSDKSIVPSVTVKDVRTGKNVDLGSIVPNDKPILLWAWAPHCPSCRAEAGAVESFAKKNSGKVDVIGVGTQDDFDYAKRFISDTGLSTPRMLWDPGFESWQRMGITAQPTWILVDGSGNAINGGIGPIPEQAVEEYLRG